MIILAHVITFSILNQIQIVIVFEALKSLPQLDIFMWNWYISQLDSPCNLNFQGDGCQIVICLKYHPFASYGSGWFSCFLESFSERNLHQLHVQLPSKLLKKFKTRFHDYPLLPFMERSMTSNHPHNAHYTLYTIILPCLLITYQPSTNFGWWQAPKKNFKSHATLSPLSLYIKGERRWRAWQLQHY